MAEPKSVGASIDGKFDDMDRRTANLREELDQMRKDTMRRFDALDEKMSSFALELKNLSDRADAHTKMLDESVARAGELSKSIGLLQTPLETLVKVENMVRDLGEQYGNVQEEVSRQKELQVTMLEQHNDLRLTVHRQQPLVDTGLVAAAPLLGGAVKSTARPDFPSSQTLHGNTSPIRFPDEPAHDEDNRKRTAFARNSASFDAEAIDSNAMRADSVPASLKRRRAKQDLKAGHGRHSSESSIIYEQHLSSDEIVVAAAQVHRRVSRELPLQSPGTRKILEELENGRDNAEVLRASHGKQSAAEPRSTTPDLSGQTPATEYPATQPLPTRVPESPHTTAPELPPASTQPPMEPAAAGPRRSSREPKKPWALHGFLDTRKLKPRQMGRPLTEEEIEQARS